MCARSVASLPTSLLLLFCCSAAGHSPSPPCRSLGSSGRARHVCVFVCVCACKPLLSAVRVCECEWEHCEFNLNSH